MTTTKSILVKIGLLWAVACLGVSGVSAQTEQKIATINLKKVFDNYYKTKIADSRLKKRGAEFEKTLKSMYKEYQSAQKEYKQLIRGANDQVVSNQERQRKKKAAQKKLRQIRQLEKEVKQFDRTAKSTLQEKQRRMREKIMKEVSGVVEQVAKSKGYTLVLDTAAKTINQTPALVYSNGQSDISDEVLKRLNRNAPEDLPEVSDSEEESDSGLPGGNLPDLPSPGELNP